MTMENIDALKKNPREGGRLTYKLKNADVFVSKDGFHFIDYLDPVEEILPEIDASQLTDEVAAYIETQLQANAEKFDNQANIVKQHLPLQNAKVLDVGCGGGLFLSLLKQQGADVIGIELSDSRAQYAKAKHRLVIDKHPIESDHWQSGYATYFDAVTLWDVIEHVNYPLQTLQSVANVLKEGGVLLIDTPCRDSFYHRFGELTYRFSGGRFPTFLNAMYSSHLFGHKQIFSTDEMKQLFESVGFEVVDLHKFHELSFPYEFYLKKLFKSQGLVNLVLPFVRIFFKVFKIRNKMLVVGKKT
ncbi:MAG TPA: class I SAM-dependent methyltransferase [Anaerolineales bacterium]|jgi:cyclopropane fatty-acyl-phospholipid synthase-like methyltransferase|nr:class I SAM-dependent methyltransferase [Anaerolineales bacterium]